MTEVVSSRSGMTAFGATVFLAFALLAWLLSAPDWARWAGILFALAGIGLAYRLLVPVNATLTVDLQGIRWSIGKRQCADIPWSEIRHLRQSADDDTFRLEIGKLLESHIPTEFLRSKQAQSEFLKLAATARPDLSLERL